MKRKAGGQAAESPAAPAGAHPQIQQQHQPEISNLASNQHPVSSRSNELQERQQKQHEYEEKLRKSLDLTIFVNYLKDLYRQDESDNETESSDNEDPSYFQLSPLSILPPTSNSSTQNSPFASEGGQHCQSDQIPNGGVRDINSFSTIDLNLGEHSFSKPATEDLLRYNHNRNISSGGKIIRPTFAASSSVSVASSVRSSVNGSITTKSSCSSLNNSTLSDEEDEDDSIPVLYDESEDDSESLDEGNNSDSDFDMTLPISDHELSRVLEINQLFSCSKESGGNDTQDSLDYVDALFSASKMSRKKMEVSSKKQQNLSVPAQRKLPPATLRNRVRQQNLESLKAKQTLAGAMSTFKTPLVLPTTFNSHGISPGKVAPRIKLEPLDKTFKSESLKEDVGTRAPIKKKRKKNNNREVDNSIHEQVMDINTSQSTLSLDSYFKFDNELPSLKTRNTSSTTGSLDKKLVSTANKKMSLQRKLELLNQKRKRVYILMCKKDIPKAHKTRMNNFHEKIGSKRRLAQIAEGNMHRIELQKQLEEEEKRKSEAQIIEAIQEESITLHCDKKEIENEVIDKIEILKYCPLTPRQKSFYGAIRRKINVDDLVKSACSSKVSQYGDTNLMNFIMEFRKVCNHPDLLQKRQIRSPFRPQRISELYPKLLLDESLQNLALMNQRHLMENKLCIYHPEHIHRSLFPKVKVDDLNVENSNWSFVRFMGIDLSMLYDIHFGNFGTSLKSICIRDEMLKLRLHNLTWKKELETSLRNLFLIRTERTIFPTSMNLSKTLESLIFTSSINCVYELLEEEICSNSEESHSPYISVRSQGSIVPETDPTKPAKSRRLIPYVIPQVFFCFCPKVSTSYPQIYFGVSRTTGWTQSIASSETIPQILRAASFHEGFEGLIPKQGFSQIIIPGKENLITDSGKLVALDELLKTLKAHGHRVLIYCQMTRMINLLEEYIKLKKWTYERYDGSSNDSLKTATKHKLEIFVQLLSTRSSGVELNLKSFDTVIFYDSSWKPSVDLEALNQIFKVCSAGQITVYRLICKDTIEERILQRGVGKNQEPSEVGISPRADVLKLDVVSLVLDDEELINEYRQKVIGKKQQQKIKQEAHSSSSMNLRSRRPVTQQVENLVDSSGSSVTDKKSSQVSNPGASVDALDEIDVGCEMEVETLDMSSSEIEEEESEGEDDSQDYDVDVVDGSTVPGHSSHKDDDEDFSVQKRPKLGRGMGKRGRPPLRVRLKSRDYDGRRRGRPRLKPFGPANQGIRGRKPGRPPLSKRSETLTSYLTPTTASQSVFGCYSSPDLDS